MSDDEKDLFNMREAAEYLGLHEQTLRYHVKKGRVAHDFEMGKMLIFRRDTLDKFKAWHLEGEGITIREIAEVYEIGYHTVHYHERKGRLTQKGLRDGAAVYDPDEAYELAVMQGWVKPVEEDQPS